MSSQLDLSLIPSEHLTNLQIISQTLREKGETCYLVGGSVRDLFLGKIPHEYDLTTSALPRIVQASFKRVIETGIAHGTVTVLFGKNAYEITTFRSDGEYTDGRRPDDVQFGVSLEADLERRDFTMNALALNIETNELFDFHNGIDDIQNRIIRTIGNPIQRFTEDGLRPIRGIRFVASLGFELDRETINAFAPTKAITAKISVERFTAEIRKILYSSNLERGIDLLIEHNYFELLLQNKPLIQPKKNILNLLASIEKAPEGFYWAVLYYVWFANDNPKPEFFRKLKLSNQIEKEAKLILEIWKEIFERNSTQFSETEIKTCILRPIRDFLAKSPYSLESEILSILTSSGNLAFPNFGNKLFQIYSKKEPLLLNDLAINGNLIKKHFPDIAGKELGLLLNHLLEKIIEFPEKNSLDELLTLSNSWIKNRSDRT
ncbi:hypothetical protein [Leptospira sp. GIMC2001]|uniref:hypothetical protein n=1 Tax=Leptospira sp. GIMC2001 TaxID=1513297 RepID=UPI002349BB88|nr:hypothetical protein [Leptospira sp. GIMC2001]WCL49950.1 hypothetical protein O4O04_03780 [Leptospira sp. GIMC2001]